MIGPVPEPVEGLKELAAACRPLEKGVPLIFESVEAGSRRDEFQAGICSTYAGRKAVADLAELRQSLMRCSSLMLDGACGQGHGKRSLTHDEKPSEMGFRRVWRKSSHKKDNELRGKRANP
jgi:hypothetical protein